MMLSEQNKLVLGEQAGLLWTWWRGDPLPALPPLPDCAIEMTTDVELLTRLTEIAAEEVVTRLQSEQRPYIARLAGNPVAYGWSAINECSFGNRSAVFHVPSPNRYLYDCVTLPFWRGLGIYPRLLQAILSDETTGDERYWIVHQLSNTASRKGIAKAGFQIACHVYHLLSGGLALLPDENVERARAGAELLKLPLMCLVTSDYQAAYADPITFEVGEQLEVSAKEDCWNGNPAWTWIWCTNCNGKSGWVPKTYIQQQGGSSQALFAYTASELSVSAGEYVSIAQEESGWLWCTNCDGKSGWVPIEHLAYKAISHSK